MNQREDTKVEEQERLVPQQSSSESVDNVRKYIGASVFGVMVITAVVYSVTHPDQIQELKQVVQELAEQPGPAGPLVFIAVYVISAVFFLPGSILTLLAGYVYGSVKGTALVSIASTLGAASAFVAGRYFVRPLIEDRVKENARFAAVDQAIASQGARVVFLLRLSPLVPYSLLNYMLGLTKVSFVPYIIASQIGMLPGTFAYVYLGELGKTTVEAAGGGAIPPLKIALYVVGGIATILVTRLVAKQAQQALENSSEDRTE